MFDGYLRERAATSGERFVPFDPVMDYDDYVDGKPRYDGVRSFLSARGIALPRAKRPTQRMRRPSLGSVIGRTRSFCA
jgi:hypothetical protein